MRIVFLLLSYSFLFCKKAPEFQKQRDLTRERPVTNFKYFVTSRNGANLHHEPSTNGKVLAVIPFNTEVLYISKGDYAEIEGIQDRWFEVDFKGLRAWLFGGLLSSVSNNLSLAEFHGGCLREDCRTCDAIRFVPGGQIFLALGCHDGQGEGTWRVESNAIMAEVTFLPGCYDSCMPPGETVSFSTPEGNRKYSAASKAYVEKHKYMMKLKFFIKSDSTFDYEILSSSRPVDQVVYVPPKPIGRMRHFAVSK